MEAAPSYDVVICGAGLAGLTLARQLKLELPQLSIAIIDRMPRPLPEAAHKVGEATIEVSATYLAATLGLKENLTNRHLRKLGLRFFLGKSADPFEKRFEIGPRVLPPIDTYQLDRGRLENDLREIIAGMGIALFESTVVDDIALTQGEQWHAVLCTKVDNGEKFTLSGRWVIDALGRRQLLKSKLGLMQPNGHSASAAWWRVNSRVDINAMGASTDRAWQRRVIDDRNLSTNHLLGCGYWVWLIPLASGSTSIGIVTDETIHPLSSYGRSYEQALNWLHAHEPAAWRLLKNLQILDFHRLKEFSYHSRQIFSHDRWACVGEAGLFLDPLYSPGSDFIALGNTITVEMIGRDLRGELTEAAVNDFNRLVLEFLAPISLAFYKDTYQVFGHAHIFSAKFAWDVALEWSLRSQVISQGIIRNPTSELFALMQQYKELNLRVQRLFVDWAKAAPPRPIFLAPCDLTRMRFLQVLHLELTARRDTAQFLHVARLNLDRLEELAQILFWQAIKECLPDHMPKATRDLPWINPWQMSLAPDRWKQDRLFEPVTAPRPLRPIREGTFAGIFGPMTWRETMRVEPLYRLRHIAGGRLGNVVIRFLLRCFFSGKPGIRVRRLFIPDYPSTSAISSRFRKLNSWVARRRKPGDGAVQRKIGMVDRDQNPAAIGLAHTSSHIGSQHKSDDTSACAT